MVVILLAGAYLEKYEKYLSDLNVDYDEIFPDLMLDFITISQLEFRLLLWLASCKWVLLVTHSISRLVIVVLALLSARASLLSLSVESVAARMNCLLAARSRLCGSQSTSIPSSGGLLLVRDAPETSSRYSFTPEKSASSNLDRALYKQTR